jgi:rhamnogalacturonyl hydrolase YesR
VAGAAEAPSAVFTRDAILAAMRKVNDYRLTQEVGRKWEGKPGTGDDWVGGTYYTGVMALYRATGDKALLDQAVAWAERGKWAPGSEAGVAPNCLTCCQTYLELYRIQKDEMRIVKTREFVDTLVERDKNHKRVLKPSWGYVDALYVGPPAIVMLGEITGDKKYYEYADKAFWGTTDDLLSKEDGLLYRDRRSMDFKTEQGKKVIWGRGNGWAIGAIPRIMEHLPADWPTRPRYIELLKTLSAAVAKVQQPDGLWRTNLADPEDFPHPDTSGAAFFCYAMAWGLREGHLEKKTYLPVVAKAWLGMLNCIGRDGRLGYAQSPNGGPAAVRESSSQPYTDGAFLLAGSELLKLTDDLAALQVTVEPVRPAPARQGKYGPKGYAKPAPAPVSKSATEGGTKP